MTETEKNFLALSMTQTYFMMMPDDLKKEYLNNPNGYDELFITKYEQAINKINLINKLKQDKTMQPFGDDNNSLDGRIK